MINSHLLKIQFILLFSLLIVFSCKEKEIEKKIDPGLRLYLKHQKDASLLDQQATIVFKAKEDLTETQTKLLQKTDIKIISNNGSIYTASLPTQRIIDLAKMEFIEFIQRPQKFKTTTRDTTEQLSPLKEF